MVLLGYNAFTRTYLLLYINNAMIALSVGGQVAIILFHEKLEPEVGSSIFIVSICGTTYLIVTYFKMGEINEYSKKCIGSWNQSFERKVGEDDKKLLRKYLSSLQPCKIELREFGFYRKPGSLRIIGKLVYYTSKGILVIGRFIPHFNDTHVNS
jgi:hypothetical protein